MILPGQQIGVLGGGQLGMFFAEAARKMGYCVIVWDPDPKAPAALAANSFICAPFDDPDALLSFLHQTKGVTYEWENIPAALVSKIEQSVTTSPSSAILRLIQNRITQKDFLRQHHFPVVPYDALDDPSTLSKKSEALGLPCIVKTAVFGYDGQGQWHLTNMDYVLALSEQLKNNANPAGWIVEKKVDLDQELSVIVVSDNTGTVITYPVSENRHEQGVLRVSRVPANIDSDLAKQATTLAANAISALKGQGVFCVEMFLTKTGELLINEIAPRPHNSGHYTMDVCSVSQFEQQVRVVCGLPIIPPELFSPSVLINILGDEIKKLTEKEQWLQKARSIDGIRFYHYKKEVIKSGRKMGHFQIFNSDAKKAMQKADTILQFLKG
ncbi:MAG: 5-(carboxyamino)imidazole ribonucleotide synthase [Nitrospirota bacterium]